MFNKQLIWFKKKWIQIIQSNSSPGEISLGSAIGVFCGIFPLIGFQTLIMILLLWLFRRSNNVAAFLSSWIMNQFTLIPILYMDYKVGILFVPIQKGLNFTMLQELFMDFNCSEFFSVGKEIFYPMLLGGFICGLLGAIITYVMIFLIVKVKMQKK
jgi:hypothetical protein